jgi:aryl-alcohol dehydrogenase-like predicted oxidoreductase
VIVYQPLQAGILTDGMSHEVVAAFPENDERRPGGLLGDEFCEPAFSRSLALRDALRPIASRHSTTVIQVAVSSTVAWPGVTAAIVGARGPEEVDGYLGGLVPLTAEDLSEISKAIVSTGAGGGPTAFGTAP